MNKRITLKQQFAITLTLIMLSGFITSVTIGIFLNHSFSIKNNVELDPKYQTVINRLINYIQLNGSSILELNRFDELKKIIGNDQIDFYLFDQHHQLIFNSHIKRYHFKDYKEQRFNSYFPIFDKNTKELKGSLVLVFNTRTVNILFLIVEFIIPFACLVFYTLIFAGVLSGKIRKPLNELMTATVKIKAKDLDFTVSCDQNNEIGDLARALEDMRSELKDSLIREWQLEHDRREMVAALTHDLRTPLAIIQGHVEGLQDGLIDNPEKRTAYLQTITQNTTRVKNLVDEMNVLTEVESEGFELNPNPINLQELVKSKINDFEIMAANKRIAIEVKINDNRLKKSVVPVDTNRLAQVIDNVMSNSIRFTPLGGNIRIVVDVTETGADFKISDSGPGFAVKDLPNLFKKFYKGDPSRSLEKGHSGLGLYIAKLIIEKHGGTIKAANQAEGGAVVEFSITYLKRNPNELQ